MRLHINIYSDTHTHTLCVLCAYLHSLLYYIRAHVDVSVVDSARVHGFDSCINNVMSLCLCIAS